MSTKKYEAKFATSSDIEPCRVFIGPSKGYPGYVAVTILYVSSNSGSFASEQGKMLDFDVENKLFKTDVEALEWAERWLIQKSQTSVTLHEIIG